MSLLENINGPEDLHELSDQDLIEAIGGRRREELHAAYEAWEPAQISTQAPGEESVESVCMHHPAYPAILRGDALAPHTLSMRGGTRRLKGMLDEKVVAIVGTRRATDYGMELARELARGLAVSGVTVASGLGEGIPSAVQTGTLEAHARPLSVIAGSLTRCSTVASWAKAARYRSCPDRRAHVVELGGKPRAIAHSHCSPS